MQLRRRGQSTAEYAIVLSIVIAAVIGMQLYVKRGMQGKFKTVTDQFTNQRGTGALALTNSLNQYEPYYGESNLNVNQTSTGQEKLSAGGAFSKTNLVEGSSRRGTITQGVNVTAASNWR